MQPPSLAVLVSGGLDSAILLASAAQRCASVVPIYVRCGLKWESVEHAHLQRFISGVGSPKIRPTVTLDVPMRDVYGPHWSVTAAGTPDADSPDDAVYLPGRNVILLAKPLIWCAMNNVPAIALAVLKGNPFPDATPAFFSTFAKAVSDALSRSVRIETPYASQSKADVLRIGSAFPLEHTFSCIAPNGQRHCGRCNKCAERRRAFAEADLRDPTDYSG